MMNKVMGIILAQVSENDKYAQVNVNEGVRRHGDEALKTPLSEFGQIHNHKTFDQLDINGLSWEIKK